MATKITADRPSRPAPKHRRQAFISGVAVRVLIAVVISWLIVLAFFVTHAASH